jgi:hypothetical protein
VDTLGALAAFLLLIVQTVSDTRECLAAATATHFDITKRAAHDAEERLCGSR